MFFAYYGNREGFLKLLMGSPSKHGLQADELLSVTSQLQMITTQIEAYTPKTKPECQGNILKNFLLR